MYDRNIVCMELEEGVKEGHIGTQETALDGCPLF